MEDFDNNDYVFIDDEIEPTRTKKNYYLEEIEKINNEMKNKNRRGYEQSMELLKQLEGNTVIDTVRKPINSVNNGHIFMDYKEFNDKFNLDHVYYSNGDIMNDLDYQIYVDRHKGNYLIDMSMMHDENPLNITNPYGQIIILGSESSGNGNYEFVDLVDTGIEGNGDELTADGEIFELINDIFIKLVDSR